MVEPRPILPIVREEAGRLKWFEAFMRRRYQFPCCPIIPTESVIRVELEQRTYADRSIVHELGTDRSERISGLQVLLEGAPPLPEHKLLWHCTIEKLLDGTRQGLI